MYSIFLKSEPSLTLKYYSFRNPDLYLAPGLCLQKHQAHPEAQAGCEEGSRCDQGDDH